MDSQKAPAWAERRNAEARWPRVSAAIARRWGGIAPGARIATWWFERIENWRGRGLVAAAVAFGSGAGLYLGAWQEPVAGVLWGACAMAGIGTALGVWGPEWQRPLTRLLALLAIGFVGAALRTAMVAAPVLPGPRHGAIEGRIVLADRGASGALRLTLDDVVLPGVAPSRTPARLRISLADGAIGQPGDLDPVIGTRVNLTGFLGPPGGPAEPGGFDFRRLAWFQQLGAIGYTRTPVLARAPPDPGWALRITQVRQALSRAILGEAPSQARALVAAVLTGDRSGISPETIENLRRTNLSHLLAISGLHMGLLTGVVYGAARALLALWPWAALWLPIRKIAAVLALLAACVYLLLSGGNVATQRAFVMAAAMLVAVLVDRRALSIRTLALAALVILTLHPEALITPGFQMSFAATLALVAGFAALRQQALYRTRRARAGAPIVLLRAVAGMAACSLIAGFATAPYSAAHFGRFAEFGLVANMAAVPAMGLLVMPAAVLTALLWPVGLHDLGLRLMEGGADWILTVARIVGGWDGAERLIAQPPGWVLPTFSLAGLWIVLTQGWARIAGLPVLAFAFAAWIGVERPALLIDAEAALVGMRTARAGPAPVGAERAIDTLARQHGRLTPETPQAAPVSASGETIALSPQRVLSRGRGASYTAAAWAESDADPAPQAQAFSRDGRVSVDGGSELSGPMGSLVHLHGRRGAAALPDACRPGAVIVIDSRQRALPPGGCIVIDPIALRDTGALAIAADGRALRTDPPTRPRPWVRPADRASRAASAAP